MRVLGVFIFSAYFVIMPKWYDRGKCEIEVKKSFNVNAKLRLFDRYLVHYNLRLKGFACIPKTVFEPVCPCGKLEP